MIPLSFLARDTNNFVSNLIAFSCTLDGFGEGFITHDALGCFSARSISLHELEETSGTHSIVCHDWFINVYLRGISPHLWDHVAQTNISHSFFEVTLLSKLQFWLYLLSIKVSLDNILTMSTLRSANVHYIHCMKANSSDVSDIQGNYTYYVIKLQRSRNWRNLTECFTMTLWWTSIPSGDSSVVVSRLMLNGWK